MTSPLSEHIAAVLARNAQRPHPTPRRDTGHCGRAGCPCTHTEGCDHGWIELPPTTNPETGITYDRVTHCPICHAVAVDKDRRESRNTR